MQQVNMNLFTIYTDNQMLIIDRTWLHLCFVVVDIVVTKICVEGVFSFQMSCLLGLKTQKNQVRSNCHWKFPMQSFKTSLRLNNLVSLGATSVKIIGFSYRRITTFEKNRVYNCPNKSADECWISVKSLCKEESKLANAEN